MARVNLAVALAVVGGLGASAWAQQNGDVIYTDVKNRAIKLLKVGGGVDTLFTFADKDVRLAGITAGPNGTYYVGSGPLPFQNPSTAAIYQLHDLFGTPSFTTLAKSDPIQNPHGVMYDPASNHVFLVNNPFNPMQQQIRDGLFAVNAGNGVVSTLFDEPPTSDPRPRYEAGMYMAKDPNSSSYFVTSLNGGSFVGTGGDDDGSTLWRMDVDPNDLSTTMSLVKDLSVNSLGVPLTQLRGVTAVPGTNDLYVTDNALGAVFKVILDGSGNYVDIKQIADGFKEPESIIYNPFTNQLVVDEGTDFATPQISTMNLDGSNRLVVAGDHARGFVVVPAPQSLALLGVMGAIAGLRRRR